MIHKTIETGSGIFKIVFQFPIGRTLEPKRALLQSTTALLKKSTRLKSNATLHRILDKYSIQIDIYSTSLYLMAEMYCHKNFLDNAIPLFFEIIFDADFKHNQWKLVKQQLIGIIQSQLFLTDYWADKQLSEYIFSKNPSLGYYSQPSDYETIKIDDIQNFYSTHIQNTYPEVFIAGDNLTKAENLITNAFILYPLLTKKKSIKPNTPIPEPLALEKKLHNSSQASLRLATIIPRFNFNDFMAMELWNMMLGGHFMSELMSELRVKKGYTYGVYSHLKHFPDFSIFQISMETSQPNVNPSIVAINKLFSRLQKSENIDFSLSKKQYIGQWSKNSEKSFSELNYKIKMKQYGYSYSEFKQIMQSNMSISDSTLSYYKNIFLNSKSYIKSIAY